MTLCPYCLLHVYEQDTDTIRDRRRLWHGPCWALAHATGDDQP